MTCPQPACSGLKTQRINESWSKRKRQELEAHSQKRNPEIKTISSLSRGWGKPYPVGLNSKHWTISPQTKPPHSTNCLETKKWWNLFVMLWNFCSSMVIINLIGYICYSFTMLHQLFQDIWHFPRTKICKVLLNRLATLLIFGI